MKYEIETLVTVITEENKADIKEILFGKPYNVMTVAEGVVTMKMDDATEARVAFHQEVATARRREDGSIEIRIPQLLLDKEDEILDYDPEGKLRLMPWYELMERAQFDEESLRLFRELGYSI